MFPRWLSWLVLGLLGYLLVTGTLKQPVKDAAVPAETHTVDTAPAPAATYPNLSAATDIERWKRSINPVYAENTQCDYMPKEGSLSLKAVDDVEGTGPHAKCGDTIHVTLTVWNGKGAALYTGELPLNLGEQQAALGLDAGLVGLRVNGTRTLILPADSLSHAKKTNAPKPLFAALKPGSIAIVTVTRLPDSR